MLIHSHGIDDSPLTPQDISYLFYGKGDPRAVSAIFVIGPGMKMIMFRGKKTPQWKSEVVENKTEERQEIILRTIRRSLKRDMSRELRIDISKRETMAFLHSIAKAYDLSIYTCGSVENIAQLEQI